MVSQPFLKKGPGLFQNFFASYFHVNPILLPGAKLLEYHFLTLLRIDYNDTQGERCSYFECLVSVSSSGETSHGDP